MGQKVVVGSIGAPHGVRGWVRVNSFTEPADNLFSYQLLLEAGNDNWQPIKVEKMQPHGNVFVAKLANVDDRDQAALITNAKIAVQREDLPELANDEFYWNDLMGLTVYNQDDIKLGQVVDFFATGANDVIVVRGESGEHLIPYVPEMFILDVNLETKQIKVLWDLEF